MPGTIPGPFLQHQSAYKLPCKLLRWLESINSTKLLQMILNLTAGEEILLTLPANIGTKSRLRLILLELPEDKLSATCTLSVPVQTTLVKLSDCSVDTNNSVSLGSGSGGTFMAPEDGVYKAVYNGKLRALCRALQQIRSLSERFRELKKLFLRMMKKFYNEIFRSNESVRRGESSRQHIKKKSVRLFKH